MGVESIKGVAEAQLNPSAETLWRFSWDSRMGLVESYFVATAKEIQEALGEEIYFGEILGKHSEVQGILEAGDFELISTDQRFVSSFKELVGSTGHCPLDYLEEEG